MQIKNLKMTWTA